MASSFTFYSTQKMRQQLLRVSNDPALIKALYPALLEQAGRTVDEEYLVDILDLAFADLEEEVGASRRIRYEIQFYRRIRAAVAQRSE